MWKDPSVVKLDMPHDSAAVTVTDITVGSVQSWEYGTDEWGNRYIEVVRKPAGPINHSYTATLGIHSYRTQLAMYDPSELPPEVKQFLGRTPAWNNQITVDPFGPRAQAAIRDAQLDTGWSPERLAALMQWSKDHVTFLPPGSPIAPIDSETALTNRGGHCGHLAVAKVALARALGIPARVHRGNSAIQPGQPYPLWHSEPEYYLNGLGWIMPAGGVEQASLDPWATLNNCVWKYNQGNSGDPNNPYILEAIEYNPQPRLAISRQRLLKEWV